MRQPPAPSVRPCERLRTERLARAPSRRHPAPPCPRRPSPPQRGPDRWTSKTLDRRTVHQAPPLARQAGDRAPRGARSGPPSPGRPPSAWLSPAAKDRLTCPFARSRSVVGPPVARWASSHGIQSLVDSARRHERNTGVGLFALRTRPLRTWDPRRASPRARHPVTGTPATPISSSTACVVEATVFRRPPSFTLQSP